MAGRRPSILETYRALVHDPVSVYRNTGGRGDFRPRRMLFHRVGTASEPEIVRHVLVTHADNYRKTPIARSLLEPVLGRGLLTSEGSFWRRQRRIAAPAFHHRRIKGFADMMTALADEMLDRWDGLADAGEPLDVQSEMSRVTMKIITRAMFSDRLAEAEARDVSEAIRVLNRQRLRLRDFVGIPEWIPRLTAAETRAAIRTVDRTVNRIIAERRADERDRGDLLSMFMLAADEETGERMSDRQLRNEVVTMFIAGHETTATALLWTFYALDRNPEVETRLHAEVDAALGGRPPGLDDLPRLPYARMVIEETMRLYPTVGMISRQAAVDDEIAGVRVPRGTIVNLNIWRAHRDPEVWADPERFDPERFDPARSRGRPKHAYFPFGGGPRICIGNNFSLMEAQLILASVARRWCLRAPPGREVEPVGNVVLQPRGGLEMTLERREPAGIAERLSA